MHTHTMHNTNTNTSLPTTSLSRDSLCELISPLAIRLHQQPFRDNCSTCLRFLPCRRLSQPRFSAFRLGGRRRAPRLRVSLEQSLLRPLQRPQVNGALHTTLHAASFHSYAPHRRKYSAQKHAAPIARHRGLCESLCQPQRFSFSPWPFFGVRMQPKYTRRTRPPAPTAHFYFISPSPCSPPSTDAPPTPPAPCQLRRQQPSPVRQPKTAHHDEALTQHSIAHHAPHFTLPTKQSATNHF